MSSPSSRDEVSNGDIEMNQSDKDGNNKVQKDKDTKHKKSTENKDSVRQTQKNPDTKGNQNDRGENYKPGNANNKQCNPSKIICI